MATEPFDKYVYYSKSVQSPEEDASFYERVYRDVNGEPPQPCILREDFCSTFLNSCEWVKRSPHFQAVAIDLDPEPIDYGKKNYQSKLDPGAQDRLMTIEKNVLDPDLPTADIIAATNFSYFCFKDRATLKSYFASALEKLNSNGVLLLDCFGGSKCYEANEEETEHEDDGFSYFWDQDSYDPVTNFAQFYIHFKRHNEARRDKVFSYDWRMWSIPELKDILAEVGFNRVDVYWEGTDENGDGDGVFSKVNVGEECESWIAYIAAYRK